MKIWIETSSEYRFKKKIRGEEGLYAPFMTRYINMLKKINIGDIVLHYITSRGYKKKEWKSSIVGLSKTESGMKESNTRLTVDLQWTKPLPKSISQSEIQKIDEKSAKLNRLINVNFQRYIGEIDKVDFNKMSMLHKDNFIFIENLEHNDVHSDRFMEKMTDEEIDE